MKSVAYSAAYLKIQIPTARLDKSLILRSGDGVFFCRVSFSEYLNIYSCITVLSLLKLLKT